MSKAPPLPGADHNLPENVETIAAAELRQFIERVERLEEEKKAIQGDIKDVFGEAKGRGYDTKAIRKILAIRKMDENERAEQESIVGTYMAALGIPLPSY